MINILPESGRTSAKREYRMRFIAVSLGLLSVLALSTAAALVPSYLLVSISKEQSEAEEKRLATTRQMRDTTGNETLLSAEAEVTEVMQFLTATAPSKLVFSMLQLSGNDIAIARVNYATVGSSFSISGRAATRDSLLKFSRDLQKLPEVASVDLPVNDLAKNTDSAFTLTLKLSKK